MLLRRRVKKQFHTLEEGLGEEARRVRKKARVTPLGSERKRLIRWAGNSSHMERARATSCSTLPKPDT
jgi:hypothetical protein